MVTLRYTEHPAVTWKTPEAAPSLPKSQETLFHRHIPALMAARSASLLIKTTLLLSRPLPAVTPGQCGSDGDGLKGRLIRTWQAHNMFL